LLEEHCAQRCRQGFGFAAEHTRELAIAGTVAVSKHVGVRNASARLLRMQGMVAATSNAFWKCASDASHSQAHPVAIPAI